MFKQKLSTQFAYNIARRHYQQDLFKTKLPCAKYNTLRSLGFRTRSCQVGGVQLPSEELEKEILFLLNSIEAIGRLAFIGSLGRIQGRLCFIGVIIKTSIKFLININYFFLLYFLNFLSGKSASLASTNRKPLTFRNSTAVDVT